jgi:kynurenine formamidase
VTELEGQQALTNWGRWGDRDDRGTLNFITEESRLRGVLEAKQGRVVSMAYPVKPVPMAAPIPFGTSPMPAGVLQMLNFTGSPARALTDVLVINTHHAAMTHVDAVVHIPTDDKVYPGVPVNEAVRFGAVQHGSSAPFAEGVVTRGVFLDLAPGGQLAEGRQVDGADLDQAAQRAGVMVEAGDALIVRGGWVLSENVFSPVPWMSPDAVRWMADREVSIFGGDIGDRPPIPPIPLLAMHQIALGQLGMPLIDNVDTSGLAQVCKELGRCAFLFVLGTIPVTGATGLPVNPLAIF